MQIQAHLPIRGMQVIQGIQPEETQQEESNKNKVHKDNKLKME